VSTPGALHSNPPRGRKAHNDTYGRLITASETVHNAGYGRGCGLSFGDYLYRLSPLNVASACCLSHGLVHMGRYMRWKPTFCHLPSVP